MKTILYIVVITLLALTMASCNTDNKGKEEQEEHSEEGVVTLSKKQQKYLNLKTGSFELRNLTTVVKINGVLSVSPESKADVSAIIGGNVKKINIFQGDKVQKGQTLAVLEHPDYISLQEEFATIANSMDYLKQEYERQKELFDNNVGAGKYFQKAKTDYNIAKIKYEGLRSRLLMLGLSPSKVKTGTISSTVNIVSPISGYVNKVNINIGEYVDAKTKLFELSDNSKIHADFKVYEKDVYLLKSGQIIHFTVANNIENEYDAKIFAISKEFDTDSRSINIHAEIEGDKKGLVPGMYITGHLHTDKNYVKTLPNDAIVTEGVKSFIFVVEEEHDENTEFKKIEIAKGQSDDGYTQVNLIDELPENAQIVLNKAYYLLSDMGKDEMGDDD